MQGLLVFLIKTTEKCVSANEKICVMRDLDSMICEDII